MTNEEAINEIKWVKYYGFINDENIIGTNNVINALDKAIEALKNQIPKKPERIEAYPHRLYCPNCYWTFCYNEQNADGIRMMQMYNYCPNCGQPIDWSDVDDKRTSN